MSIAKTEEEKVYFYGVLSPNNVDFSWYYVRFFISFRGSQKGSQKGN
ncbi:hypothetical protein [Flavobacterium sp.]|nr:hypothetical protein [Flavobacterium sp.]